MAGSQKKKFMALLDILYHETDENHPLTAPQLVEKLAGRDIPCERKAIYRDIRSLEEFGFEIMRSTNPAGHYRGERLFEAPELRMLADSVIASEFITRRKTVEMLRKLEKLTSVYHAQEIARSQGIPGRPKNRNEGIYYSVDVLNEAIAAGRRVHFSYYRHVIRNGKAIFQISHEFSVSPYALIWNDGKYYLVANYDKYDNLSHFRLDRMKQVEMLGETARPLSEVSRFTDGFREDEYLGGIFEMYAGSYEDYVDLHCSVRCIEHVVERFGHEIYYHAVDEGSFSVRVKAVINDGLVSWILAQRGGVSVLSPPELAERVRGTLRDMLGALE